MPALLLPAGLIALVALGLPLLIHLARRTEQRPTDFAALRWLRQKPRPRHRPRFDERLLLAMRLILLALIALWLARPVLPGSADDTPVIAVAPGVDPVAVTLPGEGRRWWLAPGFPAIDRPPPSGPVPVGSLLRDLDATLPAGTPLTVVVPATLIGADAERPRLSRPVTWRIVPGAMPAVAAPRQPPPVVAIRSDAGREGEMRYLRAAVLAWPSTVTAGDVDRPIPAGTTHLVWLAPGRLPTAVTRWIAGGGAAIVGRDTVVEGIAVPVSRDTAGRALIESVATGPGRVLRFTRALTPAVMPVLVEPGFPGLLRDVLRPAPAPTRVAAADYRPVRGGPAPVVPARDLQPWLAVGIALIWLAERWLATRPGRMADAWA